MPIVPRALDVRAAPERSERLELRLQPVNVGRNVWLQVERPERRQWLTPQIRLKIERPEFDLLHHMASHPRRVYTRDELMETVWGYAFAGDTSTVTVHMRRLREKIELDPAHPRYLQTVWGVGYRFVG